MDGVAGGCSPNLFQKENFMSIDIGMSDEARQASADALKTLLGETYAL